MATEHGLKQLNTLLRQPYACLTHIGLEAQMCTRPHKECARAEGRGS
jgi:hypothetical protein